MIYTINKGKGGKKYMKKNIFSLLVGLFLFCNLMVVNAKVKIEDVEKKLPDELIKSYASIYKKEASEDKVTYQVSIDNNMLYITEEKDGKTLFVDGFTIQDDEINYEVFYNLDTDYKELENRNKVNYLALFNVVASLSGYKNYNNDIIKILENGDYKDNGYNITREKNDANIKETFKINYVSFLMDKELENENTREGNSGKRRTGYVIATIIVIAGLSLLVFLNRDVIFGGKFFK